ncbi:MAG: P-II family nitrogen regulator [Prolixibacteraceae bacterium]|jgi:nitrogen regulatory protein P-II 1|nr:P-II family nitrogen regulator [Prolixibacteraceae bacterium]
MKLLKAFIRRRKTEDVFNTLKKEGFHSMTFVECEGTGRYSDHEKEHISEKYPYADAYKVIKIEILVSDAHVDPVIQLIRKNARTGYSGDGLIIVSPVDEAYKIRSDEKGILSI